MKFKRILVTGTGGIPSINFIRSIKEAGYKTFILGTGADPLSLEKSEADISYLCPPSNDKKYIKFLNFLINKHKIEFLHCQNDDELQIISKYREKINCSTFLPSKETIEVCRNKFESYEKWRKAGINTPKTFFLNKKRDLKKAFEVFSGKVWLREITGAGGKGSLNPENIDQALAWINFKKGWGKFTAAELLSPRSVTFTSIWKDGKLMACQSRERIYWAFSKISPSGITGVTGAGKTVNDKKLKNIAIKSIYAIDNKPNGILSVDLTYDLKGVPNLTEINAGRFFTTIDFFTKAGANFPKIYIELAATKKSIRRKKNIDPLKKDLIWIRDVDICPVLTTKKNVDKHIEIYKNMLSRIK